MNSLSKRSNTVSRTTTAALCVLVPGFVFASCGESRSGFTRRDPGTGGTSGAAGEVSEGGSGGSSSGRGGSSSGRGGSSSGRGGSGTGGKGTTNGGTDAGGSDAGSGGTTGGEAATGGSAGIGGAGAGGCEGAGCGGDLCPTELRCDGVCCGAPPTNATALCEGDACAVRCNTNFHACGTTSSPCYADSDVQHCGAGCVDCRQPNATFRCENGACENACTGTTLACTPTNGKPTCASWDFESGTSEGWFVGNHAGATNQNLPSGFTGLFETRTAHATRGSRSLAVGYQGDGFDYWLAELRIRFCQDSLPLVVNGLTLKFDVYAETAPGAMPFNYGSQNHVIFWNENQPPGYEQIWSSCDFVGEPDEQMSVSCNVAYTAANATEMSILMRMFETWRGIYYFDNIRLEPTPPTDP